MNKQTMKEVSVQQVDQYVVKRKQLIEKLRMFMKDQFPAKERYFLEKEFNDRTEEAVPPKLRASFSELWMLFFYEHNEKGRLIEQFSTEYKGQLSTDEHQMIKSWSLLTPRLMSAVDRQENTVTFLDSMSKEWYHVPLSSEQETSFAPWYGTFSLIEPFGEQHMLYGVRLFEGPLHITEAKKYVDELIDSHDLAPSELLRKFYPEILAVFIQGLKLEDGSTSKMIKQKKTSWVVKDAKKVQELLEVQPTIYLEEWEGEQKTASFISDWFEYRDSLMDGVVHTTEVRSTIQLKDSDLIVESFDPIAMEEVTELLKNSQLATCESEKIDEWEIPVHAEMRNMLIQMKPETPKHFSLFAQNHFESQMNQPQFYLNNQSITELVDKGDIETVEHWLRQSEYDVYISQKARFGVVEETADYNTIRSKLNLPLSPFVTGVKDRQSSYTTLHLTKEEKADHLKNAFYQVRLDEFLHLKTEGKSDATIRKYRNSLKMVSKLYQSIEHISSWHEVTNDQWSKMLNHDLLEQYPTMSKTQCKDFISTTKAFVKWVDTVEGTLMTPEVTNSLKEVEERFKQQEISVN